MCKHPISIYFIIQQEFSLSAFLIPQSLLQLRSLLFQAMTDVIFSSHKCILCYTSLMISYLFFCSPVDEACLPEPSHITLQLPHQLLLVGELLSPKERAITKHPYSLFNLSHVMSRQCMHALGMALSASEPMGPAPPTQEGRGSNCK